MILRLLFRIKNRIILLINKGYLFFYSLEFKSFGKNNTVWFPIKVLGKSNVTIGNNCAINSFVHIWGNGGVYIGNNVMIATHVSITSLTHVYNLDNIRFAPIIKKKVTINDDVWIGTGAIILPGVCIGKGAVIGAGAVVTKDVQEFSVVVGNPARLLKIREVQ